MPDRITNTINEEGNPEPICRPTVINMYDGDLGTLDKWWTAWEAFMFIRPIRIKTRDGNKDAIPYSMLQPIKKAKYPDITEVSVDQYAINQWISVPCRDSYIILLTQKPILHCSKKRQTHFPFKPCVELFLMPFSFT